MPETFLIEIREGTGEPARIDLRSGVEMPPLGVGVEGAWRVRGGGVLGVHLFFYFDGRALFAQSADPTKPAVVNGKSIGVAWTPLTPPSTIALGTARLVFRRDGNPDDDGDKTTAQPVPFEVLPDDDRTVAEASPVRTVAAARPFPPGAFSSRSDESTRFAPIDSNPDSDATRVVPLEGNVSLDGPTVGGFVSGAKGGAARPAAAVRPAAGVPWSAPSAPVGRGSSGGGNVAPLVLRPTDPDLMRQDDPDEMGGLNSTVFQPAQLPGSEGARQPGRSGPYPQAPGTEAQPPAAGIQPNLPRPPGASLAKPEGKLAKEWRAASTTRKILYFLLPPALGGAFWVIFAGNDPQPVRRAKPKGASSASASDSATPSSPGPSASDASAVPDQPVAPPTPTPTAPPPAAATPVPIRSLPAAGAAANAPDGGDRRERTAADDVATGQFEPAAQIYDQLALEHPENPAFGEAARILRQKLDAGLR